MISCATCDELSVDRQMDVYYCGIAHLVDNYDYEDGSTCPYDIRNPDDIEALRQSDGCEYYTLCNVLNDDQINDVILWCTK